MLLNKIVRTREEKKGGREGRRKEGEKTSSADPGQRTQPAPRSLGWGTSPSGTINCPIYSALKYGLVKGGAFFFGPLI